MMLEDERIDSKFDELKNGQALEVELENNDMAFAYSQSYNSREDCSARVYKTTLVLHKCPTERIQNA